MPDAPRVRHRLGDVLAPRDERAPPRAEAARVRELRAGTQLLPSRAASGNVQQASPGGAPGSARGWIGAPSGSTASRAARWRAIRDRHAAGDRARAEGPSSARPGGATPDRSSSGDRGYHPHAWRNDPVDEAGRPRGRVRARGDDRLAPWNVALSALAASASPSWCVAGRTTLSTAGRRVHPPGAGKTIASGGGYGIAPHEFTPSSSIVWPWLLAAARLVTKASS